MRIEKLSGRFISFIKSYKANIIIIFIFLILPFIFFDDTFRLGSVILGRGDIIHALSTKQLSIEAFRNLEIPLWNRYVHGGHPHFNLSMFYPISLILENIFPLTIAYNLEVLVHYSLAGIFMFLLLDEYKLNKVAGFTGGLVFMFSGVMITYKSTLMLQTIIWFPLIILLMEKFRKSRRWEFLLLASVFYGLSLYGHPQIFLYGSAVLFLFIIYFAFIYERNYYFLFANIIFIAAVFLNAYVIFDAFFQIGSSVRGVADNDYLFFSTGSVDKKLLVNTIFPYIFGCKNPSADGIPHFLRWFGREDSLGMINYLGISTIPLFVFGIFRKNKEKFFWLFIMAVSFLLALGQNTPLNRIIFEIPLFNMFRNPSRHWFEFGLSFSIMCGFGMDYFIKMDKENIKKPIKMIIGLLGLIILSFFSFYVLFNMKFKERIISFFRPSLMPEYYGGTDIGKIFEQSLRLTNYSIYIPLIIIFITICFLILFLLKKNKTLYIAFIIFIFLDLFSFGHFDEKNTENIYKTGDEVAEESELDFLWNEDELFRILPVTEIPSEKIYYPNKNVYFELEYVTGYGYSEKNFAYITGLKELPYRDSLNWKELIENNVILSMLNTRYIILPVLEDTENFLKDMIKEGSAVESRIIKNGINNSYKIIYRNEEFLVLENLNFLPRFYTPSRIRKVNDSTEVRQILWGVKTGVSNLVFNPTEEALVEGWNSEKETFKTEDIDLNIIEYRNNSVSLESISDEDFFLVFSNNYYPGWSAEIGGESTEIYRTNDILQGIYVPAGDHLIQFIYLPRFYWLLTGTSILSFISIVGLFLALYIRKGNKE